MHIGAHAETSEESAHAETSEESAHAERRQRGPLPSLATAVSLSHARTHGCVCIREKKKTKKDHTHTHTLSLRQGLQVVSLITSDSAACVFMRACVCGASLGPRVGKVRFKDPLPEY